MSQNLETPQDFGLLSMSELRERPGEVLDRVADGGQAFVIERNGKRKACLVPLSVFFPDIPPSRIGDEITELTENGELPRTTITRERELVFRFSEQLSDATKIELEIVLPHGYPNACPKAYAKPIAENAPHRWNNGALCLYGVTTAWNPGKHTILSTLKLCRNWIRNYEAWKKVGNWPTNQETTNE